MAGWLARIYQPWEQSPSRSWLPIVVVAPKIYIAGTKPPLCDAVVNKNYHYWYIISIIIIVGEQKRARRLFLMSEGMGEGGDSHMKWTGMLVGNFEFNP